MVWTMESHLAALLGSTVRPILRCCAHLNPKMSCSYSTELSLALRMAFMHSNIAPSTCAKIHLANPITSVLGILCAQAILCLRTWCLYGRQYWLLLTVLLPAWIISAVFQIISMAYQKPFDGIVRTAYKVAGPPPTLQPSEITFDAAYCSSAPEGRLVSFIALAPMLLDLLPLGMMSGRLVWLRRTGKSAVPLEHAVMRAQVLYYAMAFIPSLLQVILMSGMNQVSGVSHLSFLF